jgi:hypothetical protein
MATTNFVIGTVIQPDWLNDVNLKTYWTAAQWLTFLQLPATVLTPGATVNTDATLNTNFRLIAGQNFTLANPTGLSNSQYVNYQIVQDATGSRIVTYGSKFKFPGGTAFALSTIAGSVDYISCYYDGVLDILLCVGQKGFA